MKKSISIIGGGTAGLFLAAFLDPLIFDITIFEKKKSLGRKFLVAGDGGFNLTHSDDMDKLLDRYTPSTLLREALLQFTNQDLRNWLASIGIPTFIGSSKRVFPEKGIKPIEVLKAIEHVLVQKGISFKYEKTFTGWDAKGNLIFNDEEIIDSDFKVFALGGASWKITGSDGRWLQAFSFKEIKTEAFQAANCAFKVAWGKDFIDKNEGKPLKNIALKIDDRTQKGEMVVTKFGLEGNAIYALSSEIQSQLIINQKAQIFIDFKPVLKSEVILEKLNNSKYKTTESLKRVLKLNSTQIDLLKSNMTKEEFLNKEFLSKRIKHFPISLIASAPIDEAISTTGGISTEAVNNRFELLNLKNNYCIGEMLDWNAPTGGYLIQGCASMGVFLAQYLNSKVKTTAV